MRKCYYLKTCSTCQRILKEWDFDDSVEIQDIKSQPMTSNQVDEMIHLAGSAEALFSRKAMKFRSMGLNNKDLTESDYRKYIIDEYTFLKRPVLILGDQIFIGNSKKVVSEAKESL